jgi:hypothetical protein
MICSMKKHLALPLLLLPIMLWACTSGKNDKRKLLTGVWHANKLENKDMDSFFLNTQTYIDTIGKNSTDEVNKRVYGVTNMDSMRKILQSQYDSAKNMQMDAVKNTIFDFRADSTALLTFNGSIDSSTWTITPAGELVITELHPIEGESEHVTMEILGLTDKELKLRFAENGAYSTVTFNH